MSNLLRVLRCVIGQPSFTAPCTDLSSQTILLTGPTRGGIGYTTAKILASFGARVILAARNPTTAAEAVSQIQAEVPGANVSFVKCDLADLGSVRTCSEVLRDVSVDVLICNAGLLTQGLEKTVKGVEMTFAVCVLGHHLLIELLKPRRVVWVTGDIYVLSRGVVTPYREDGGFGAYTDACLARLWVAREWKKRGLEIVCVHPGAVRTGLNKAEGIMKRIEGWVLIDAEQGAQASVLVASLPNEDIHQDWDVPYYHNKFGWMQLTEEDKAINEEEGKKLFELCDEVCGIRRD